MQPGTVISSNNAKNFSKNKFSLNGLFYSEYRLITLQVNNRKIEKC